MLKVHRFSHVTLLGQLSLFLRYTMPAVLKSGCVEKLVYNNTIFLIICSNKPGLGVWPSFFTYLSSKINHRWTFLISFNMAFIIFRRHTFWSEVLIVISSDTFSLGLRIRLLVIKFIRLVKVSKWNLLSRYSLLIFNLKFGDLWNL